MNDDTEIRIDNGGGGNEAESASQQKVVSELLSKSSFVNQLNAKLAQQQHIDGARDAASSGMRIPTRGNDHHESLMDQIRRGTSLRRARSTNDRSLPKI